MLAVDHRTAFAVNNLSPIYDPASKVTYTAWWERNSGGYHYSGPKGQGYLLLSMSGRSATSNIYLQHSTDAPTQHTVTTLRGELFSGATRWTNGFAIGFGERVFSYLTPVLGRPDGAAVVNGYFGHYGHPDLDQHVWQITLYPTPTLVLPGC